MPAQHFRVQSALAGFEYHARAFAQPLAGMHQCDPRVRVIRRTNEKAFGGAAAGQPDADQPCREHARVVDHQQIAGAQQRWEIGKLVMGNGAGGPLHRQQAAAAAFGRRVLRDQRIGQGEIELANFHEATTQLAA